jgi:hypothetical protein
MARVDGRLLCYRDRSIGQRRASLTKGGVQRTCAIEKSIRVRSSSASTLGLNTPPLFICDAFIDVTLLGLPLITRWPRH